MFSMALIPCPTHDSCDLCNKKIIYVQMWREKVTSLIAKTSCDWYKFNIRGHFQTPGGALWLVYTGQLPGNRAGLHGHSLLCKQMDIQQSRLTESIFEVFKTPYYLQDYIWIYPKSFTETLHNWNLVTSTFTESFDKDKDIKHKCILQVTSKIKAQQINGLTSTLQTVAFFSVCVLHFF